jgi:serine phosphatase RsbU (regulator of sigma subunit)
MVAHRVLEDGTLALIVIDVAGRGSAWGPLSYYLAMNLLGLLVMECRLERATSIVEHDFRCELTTEGPQFASVFAALLDAKNRRMHYVSAGHETALLLSREGSHRHLRTTGPAFGAGAKPHDRPASVQLAPGDDLIIVTNGITDARDDRGVAFGSSGVVGAALRSASSGKDPAWALIDEASRFGVREPDDRAAVVVTAFD